MTNRGWAHHGWPPRPRPIVFNRITHSPLAHGLIFSAHLHANDTHMGCIQWMTWSKLETRPGFTALTASDFLPMMTCLGVVWCTQIPTENSLWMLDPDDSMIRLGLRIQQCHQLSCKKWFLHKSHCVHHLWRLPPWLHRGRIVCIYCCRQLKKLACFAHWTSLNVKGVMNSCMRHLHVGRHSSTAPSWWWICYPREPMPWGA